VLVGSTGPNTLYGGGGDDVLVGGDGDDRLAGAPGRAATLWIPLSRRGRRLLRSRARLRAVASVTARAPAADPISRTARLIVRRHGR
jgi:Ca2+-binding RTX toxin-like protein